ncbi:hypothetical protein JCM8097_006142 [Rhodosporidiobolus ruineniae]
MKVALLSLLGAATAACGAAISASSSATATTTSPTSSYTPVLPPKTVPTGVPVPGDYSGPLRPQLHFSPPAGWANDPNGMFRDTSGLYHFYYQHNPLEAIAANQHWGHATSRDLYHWTNEPIALFPPNSTSGVFSGGIVIDANNTSGFFGNVTGESDNVVAIYTLNTPTDQVQAIGYSLDGGYSFTQLDEPIIDLHTLQFRDPKIFWHAPTSLWILSVALPQDFTIAFYTSENLREWEHASNFTNHGLLGLQYECPNLIQVPIKGREEELVWVLYLSINPGAPLGGAIGQYFIGDWNGTHFEAIDGAARIADFAKDNYATQFFGETAPGEAISIAWASNWQYGQETPTGAEGWRSSMSLPRRAYLTNATRIGPVLVSEPYQLSTVFNSSILEGGADSVLVNSSGVEVDFSSVPSGAVYFDLNITLPTNRTLIPKTAKLNVTFTASGSSLNETFATGYEFGLADGGFAWIDRGKTKGFENPFFTDKFSHASASLAYRIEGVLDRTIFELFLDDATYSATTTLYPTSPLDGLRVVAGDMPEDAEVRLAVWGLNGTW